MSVDPHRLAHAVARLNRRLRQERESPLTPTQLSVLGTVLALGSATPREIAARERVSPPSVTRTLSFLVDQGYVERSAHPDDRRQAIIALSDRGNQILRQEAERRDQWLAHRLTELTPQERAALTEATELMERMAEA